MSEYHNIEGYEPLFEVGLYKRDSPCCRVIPEEIEIDPIILASLVVVMFETVMCRVEENYQIAFENKFNEALKLMMEERFEYDVHQKYPPPD